MLSAINKIVIFLILANFFIESSFGLVAPVFSVFIVEDIKGGTLAVAGFAAAVYYIVKSVIQIFFGIFLDKIKINKERSVVITLVTGNLIMGLSALLYLVVETPLHVYGVQFLLAIGAALSVPSWYTLFSHHLDKVKESFEWSLNSSITFGLGVGVAGAIGGVIAEKLSFDFVFIIAGLSGLFGAVVLIPLYNYLNRNYWRTYKNPLT